MRTQDEVIVAYGAIEAKLFKTQTEYWQKHKELVLKAYKHYANLVVVFEDYFLYASSATAQINSHMETPQLLGVLKFLMEEAKIPYYIQSAAMVKKRWSDKVLLWKNVLYQSVQQRRFVLHQRVNGIQLNQSVPPVLHMHIRDAIRHAMHFSCFGGKHEHTP